MSEPHRRIARNPFYVLGLGVEASRAEIEREGQKLLGMLALGLSSAKTYVTPLGRFERTEVDVREAMAELRDPERRLGHELWARMPVDAAAAAAGVLSADSSASGLRWGRALECLGWRGGHRRGLGPNSGLDAAGAGAPDLDRASGLCDDASDPVEANGAPAATHAAAPAPAGRDA
ncbi:hypothetical protein [Haliangium sp.]|uniref:hypothetical protein n=1 Tax=Haliangium sp. TaxID=2663208 RepID=UPI003D0CAA50